MARNMILRLTPTTATLVGENTAEWDLLVQQVLARRWRTGPRADEGRLRALASELGVVLQVEEVGVIPESAGNVIAQQRLMADRRQRRPPDPSR
jgi:hypothetical protein